MPRLGTPKRRAPTAAERRDVELFAEMKAALEARAWTVHVARSLEGRGGDCIVRGQRRVILSHRLPMAERLDILAEAARLEGIPANELSDAAQGHLASAIADTEARHP